MPELPEVETYIRELAPDLQGRRVVQAHVYWPGSIALPTGAEFESAMPGASFAEFGRRGKYLLFGLDDPRTLIVHLRMTGKLYLAPTGAPPGKHEHVILDLDDGRSLHYQDPRKFGRLWLTPDPAAILRNLGPEPFGPDFTPAYLSQKLAGRTAAIKGLLLDQRILAGVGNIYADEALYRARLHPSRAGGDLAEDEIGRLHAAVQAVLARAIEQQGSSLGGSSLQNYMRPGGQQGGFQEEHNVFRRTGQPCPRCGHPIERIVIAQRSSHFCPICQRLETREGDATEAPPI